jgi:hypothetical protein
MPKLSEVETEKIYGLWNGKEEKYLRCSEIVKELTEKENWNERKVYRRLSAMLFYGWLDKVEDGQKGNRRSSPNTAYRPSAKHKVYNANAFFDKIRAKIDQPLMIKDCHENRNESLLVYGIPPEEELTAIEQSILYHLLNQVERAFDNLFLLKLSIRGRREVNRPLESELIENYIKDTIAEDHADKIFEEADIKVCEQNRCDPNFCLRGEMMVRIATAKYGLMAGCFENLIKSEREYLGPNVPSLDAGIYVSQNDSYIALLKMLKSEQLAEYQLNLFDVLRDRIKLFQSDRDNNGNLYVKRKPSEFDDADIFYLAKSFSNRMKFTLTLNEICSLSNWFLLKKEMGKNTNNHEKLIRCIYYFWKQHQDNIKAEKNAEIQLTTAEAKEPTVGYGDISLERITPEVRGAVSFKLPAELERKFNKNNE